MAKPLTETQEVFPYRITEDKDGRMTIAGIYQLADVKNRNNRVYTRGLWEKVLAENSDFDRRLNSRLVVGTLGHPADGKTKPADISHVVTKVWMEDAYNPDCVVCKAGGGPHTHVMAEEEVLETPHGKILKELYRAGVGMGVSSRGSGSVRGSGDEQLVSDDYRLETFDHVLDPSTPGAFPKVIAESLLGAVEKLIAPECKSEELTGYRRILTDVVESGEDDTRGSAQKLIEAIDVKLGTITENNDTKTSGYTSNPGSYSIGSALGVSGVSGEPMRPLTPPPSGEDEISEESKMAEKRVEEENTRLIQERDELQSKLARSMSEADELRAKFIDLEKDAKAANEIGEELTSQLKNARFQLKGYKEHIEAIQKEGGVAELYDGEHTVKEAFDVSRQIIEELLGQLDGAADLQVRCEAAEEVIAQVRTRERRRAVIEFADKILANESAEVGKKLRPMILEGANSPEDVSRKYSQARALMTEGVGAAPAAAQVTENDNTKPAPAAIGAKTDGALPTPGQVNEDQESSLSTSGKVGGVINEAVSEDQEFSRRVLRRLRRA
jgi:hypothetical protein